MAISERLLEILVCPETKQKLTLVEEAILESLNRKIDEGEIQNRAGKDVRERVDGALLREDRKVLYLIREDVPVMLIEEAVEVEG